MPSNSPHLLQVRDLSCERDGRDLFAGLSFDLASGCAVQIEGANGAGKTSLLRTLIGSAADFSGEILWNGESYPKALPKLRESLLYIGHRAGVRGGLTPLENLAWYGASRDAAYRALELLDLYGFEDTLCQQLSAGQNRRVALARLFLPEAPPLWILDEPLAALDVAGVSCLQGQMACHLSRGGSIVFTSHQPVGLTPLQSIQLADYAAGDTVAGGVFVGGEDVHA
ncbi:cytochrome c biogenesis heme-transporting ATPase CcmA [Microbulbifer thermotolerans]|uniref:Cytochrome c biogenesis heme-transporting ATPase CcmA n=1 Tax=Microbulbifer thermotolerans TaxID=252514 RepID=A0A143HMM7_MICTH|nr:cytochrome c biogenesis heme-transporting ATPase CcmA [Microbulbifer thermotolerans]AMX02781.1 heme ABC exporter ATP-binding protein CcmA [Microbulbifer thermotolerans]MCX2779643.1 cytochrome c biogenesis heme-transporting ATPase CcmA [Microbulbifer thermotolerans]MCX2782609.1 cytochrome c biogenesis heme-transporting ATPase CcmA [Microbulbifer thermotolerans]MCX2794621.1 cytochrome c biogenesis heme-transporting ATPase CcmA [Microbulbifer thermotolerans]MCX2801449.1 cytochrome c biogenesis